MANTLKFGNGQWYGKKDTILAYNSENNNYKPLPFSFDRDTTATRVNKDGLIETVGSGEPRVDYKDDSKGALLLEPSRSNSLLQSNKFDTTWASSTGIGISSGYGGVYGSNDAWLLKRADGNSRYLYQNVSLSNTQTFSIYLKADTTNWAWLFLGGTTSWAYFDLENGAVGATNSLLSSKIEPVSDGWFRCSITANVTLSSVRIYPAQSNLSVSGDSNLSIYIQNAQLEAGSYATSYIPTQGSIGTRVAESSSQTVPDGIINSSEGTIFAEIKAFSILGNQYVFDLSDNTSSNRVGVLITATKLQAFRISPTDTSTTINSTSISANTKYKLALAYSSGRNVFYLNGVKIGEDTNVITSLSINKLDVFQRFNSTERLGGECKDLRVYNEALTDAELAALTTI